MIQRWLGTVAATVLLAALPGSAVAQAPEGPRLAFTKFGFKPPRLELLTVDPTGALPARIVGGGMRGRRPLPYPFAAPAWSPDGSLIAFTALVGPGRHEGMPRLKIFVSSADGSVVRPVPGTSEGHGPVFGPDDRTIAFTRSREQRRPNKQGGSTVTFKSSAAWLVDIDRGEPHRLTRWRDGLDHSPSSFSPDGSVLAMTRVDEQRTQEPEAVLFSFGTGRIDLLAENATQPVYSPDGSQIALARKHSRTLSCEGRKCEVEETTDLHLLSTNGSDIRRLTDTPTKLEVSPSWDPSGQRIAYTRLRGGRSEAAALGFGSAIMQINADGTCPTKVSSAKLTVVYGPAWQPGPGREAGRVSC